MSKDLPPKKEKARDRILKAATDLFAAEGIKGATTREIGRIAGVNESTLFRNFQNKEELLKAVIENTVAEMTRVLSEIEIQSQGLREDLLQYAIAANYQMEQNEAIIRTLIGEADRQPTHADQMIESTRKPLVDKLLAYFKDKQDRGLIRQDLNLRVVLDTFSGLLLVGMLKRRVTKNHYSTQEYLESTVDILLKGIQVE